MLSQPLVLWAAHSLELFDPKDPGKPLDSEMACLRGAVILPNDRDELLFG